MNPDLDTERRWSVLLADDEPEIRQYVKDALADMDDVDIVDVAGGRDALAALSTRAFDLVITDQRMGAVDGVSVLEHARGHAPHAARMMITGYGELDLIDSAVNRAHVDRFLPKPFSPAALQEAVAQLLAQVGARHRARVEGARALATTLGGFHNKL